MCAIICGTLFTTSFLSIHGGLPLGGDGVLNTSYTWEGYGGYIASGVGTWGSSSGIITLNGIPTGATIEKAYIYWVCYTRTGLDTFIYVDGNGITGTQIGNDGVMYCYRTEITSLVTGNGDYEITDITNAYGVSIVAVYSHASSSYVMVIINDGMETESGVPIPHWLDETTFSGFVASPNPEARVTYILGDGQTNWGGAYRHDMYSFNGYIIATDHADGSDGNPTTHGWDTDTYDVSTKVTQGDTTASANVYEDNDELWWATCIFSVTTAPPVLPPVADAGPDQIVNEGDVVLFDGSDSNDPDGTIETYEWDFDIDVDSDCDSDPTNDVDATGTTPTHIYGDDGNYTAILTVIDNEGLTDTDTCVVKVQNLAPDIKPFESATAYEGLSFTIYANVQDPGSDDLTFSWDWGDGTSITENIHYNNGTVPEPVYNAAANKVKSPWGIYPFNVADTVHHTYGDNGRYFAILLVKDDDGGEAFFNFTVPVNNVAPSITVDIAPSSSEGSEFTLTASATDPGSDDLTFTWEFEYGSTIVNTYYNNGVTPEPSYNPVMNEIKSPGGTYPINALDTVICTYRDNYNYTLFLNITDDDGGLTTYTTTISIYNIAPSIVEFKIPSNIDEGLSATFQATALDLGSDDLTLTWKFEYGPTIIRTYLNDGLNPDPYPSPWGDCPFNATDKVEYIYGDNGNYFLLLTVTDDDGGTTTYNTTITVNNVAPTINPFGPFMVDEGSTLDISAISSDQGSDDLTFIWDFELGPTITNIYHNDGVRPDPFPSPWGISPFSATDKVNHIYGDNGVYAVTLIVQDDDGGSTVYTSNITVYNVVPTAEIIEVFLNVNISLRVAGEKWHSVGVYLYEEGSELWAGKVTRSPGNPDEQKATYSNVKLDMTKRYKAIVDYLPNDPRENGNVWGGNPVWIELTFKDGSTKRLHHTFNVRKSYWDSDHWNHIDPWEVDLKTELIGCPFEVKYHVTDPGSDDEILTFSYGSQTVNVTFLNDPPNPDPYPSPEVNPRDFTDTTTLIYEGLDTLILSVVDDDGDTTSVTLDIS